MKTPDIAAHLLTITFPAINVETIPATVTEQTWELIQTWMEICNTDHPHCCVNSETQDHRNPSRLLEIDPPGLNSKIRLIEGVEIPPKARYMTLSHCWGSGQPVVLNSDTWEQFRDSFAISDLPKTFQDAVKITKRLHVKYLWIDSLCIIQGSQEDWAKESGRMASVYGGSYCNIAASGASDCNGGCLGPRAQISQYRPVRVVRNTVETPSSRYLDNHFDFVCVQVGPEWRELDRCPLACRAWVFQERALAPRTLHFGLSQLYWECNQHLVCERYPESPGAIVSLMSRSYKLLNKLLQQPTDLIWWRYPELKRAWVDFMSDYSASRLTYDTDRLVAMAGIVDRFVEGLQDDFLGGLWRKRLVSQLLWRRANTRAYGRRAREYIAPSWSWVSLFDTPVYYPVDEGAFGKEKTFQILEAQVQEKRNGPKYSLCDGAIRAKCCMIRAAIHAEGGDVPKMILYSSANRSIQVPTGGINLTFDTDDWRQHKLLWLVPVMENSNFFIRETQFVGLILFPAGIGSEPYFLRCGVFEMKRDFWLEWTSNLRVQDSTKPKGPAESTEVYQHDNLASTDGGDSAISTVSYVSTIIIK